MRAISDFLLSFFCNPTLQAPILVTFECSEVPELMVEGAGPVPTPAPRMVQKACIFKTHDDCRQDQLVLQVVEYFKKIFSYHDLPLYLLPYRVITTTKDVSPRPRSVLCKWLILLLLLLLFASSRCWVLGAGV